MAQYAVHWIGMNPTTADVLRLIGRDGIVVGSVAAGKPDPKDVDVVVRDRGMKDRNPVFQRTLEAYREHCTSEVPGHLVVYANPVCVEMFEYEIWDTKDERKNANRTSYRKARRGPRLVMKVFGVEMVAVLNLNQVLKGTAVA